jgi:hypothetical protein
VYSPQAFERYAYVENDPVNGWDPSGHIRRDIELMKERKQQWRALMVAFEASLDFCGSAPEFCEAGITHSVVVWGADGSVKAVIMPGMDPAIARWQWAQAFPPPAPAATDKKPEGTAEPAPGGSTTSGGGGRGGVLGMLTSTVLNANRSKTVKQDITVQGGHGGQATAEITEGALAGTAVTGTVQTDKDGKIEKVSVTVDSDQNVVVKDVSVVGDFITVQLVGNVGDRTSVTKRTSDGSAGTESENKIGGGVKANVGGKQEDTASAGTLLSTTFGVDVGGSVGVEGSHTGKEDSKASYSASSEATNRITVTESRSVTFHVISAPAESRLQGVVETTVDGVVVKRKEIR